MNPKYFHFEIMLIFLLAFSMNGFAQFAQNDTVWKKSFGGSGNDYFNSVTVVSDGVVAVGYAEEKSFGNGDWTDIKGKGGCDAIVVKYNNNGNLLWKKSFGGDDNDYFNSVTAVSNGVVAVGSSWRGSDTGDWEKVNDKSKHVYNCNAIIVKFDNNGNIIWKKRFGSDFGVENYYAVTVVSDGIVAVGDSRGSNGTGDWQGVTFAGQNAIIVKYDNDGNVVWKKNFANDEKCSYGAYKFNSVTAVPDGIIAVGSSDRGNKPDKKGVRYNDLVYREDKSNYDAIVVKFDNDGNVVWTDDYVERRGDYYNSVMAVPDGIIAVGNVDIVKYDNNGDVKWYKNTKREGPIQFDGFSGITQISDTIIPCEKCPVEVFDEIFAVGGSVLSKYLYKDENGMIIHRYDEGEGISLLSSSYPSADYKSVVAVSDGVIAVGSATQKMTDEDKKEREDKLNKDGFYLFTTQDAIIVKYGIR